MRTFDRAVLPVLVLTALLASSARGAEPARPSPEHDFIGARLAADAGEFDEALRLIDRALAATPDDPVLQFERASILIDARRFPRGEAELRRVVERFPDFFEANRLLGRLLIDRSNGSPGRIEEGLRFLQEAYRLYPDDLASGLTIAQILVATDRFEEAAKILATVVERAPDNRTANFSYAQVLTRLGRTAEAQAYLERTVVADPTFAPAVFQLVDGLQRSREWLRAAELLEPLVAQDPANRDLQRQQAFFYLRGGRPDQARRLFEALAEADPSDERSRFFLAESMAELSDFAGAEKIYRQLLEVDPYNVDVLVSFGLTQMAMRDYDGAETTFQALLEVEAANDAAKRLARTQLAAIQHHRGNYGASLDDALRVLDAADRVNTQALNIALDIYRRKEEWQPAIDLIDRAIGQFGEDRYLLARRMEFSLYADRADDVAAIATKLESAEGGRLAVAEVYAQAKRYEEAAERLRELRAERPRDVPTLFQLGAVLERAGDFEESATVFEEALANDPDHAPTLNYLGYMWAERGVNLDRAAVMIEKAVEIDPKNGAYLDSLGWVYFRLDRFDLAEKYLVAAAEIIPDDSTIQEHLGDLYRRTGRSTEALSHYRKALGLEPEPKDEEGLKVKIAELEKLVPGS